MFSVGPNYAVYDIGIRPRGRRGLLEKPLRSPMEGMAGQVRRRV